RSHYGGLFRGFGGGTHHRDRADGHGCPQHGHAGYGANHGPIHGAHQSANSNILSQTRIFVASPAAGQGGSRSALHTGAPATATSRQPTQRRSRPVNSSPLRPTQVQPR